MRFIEFVNRDASEENIRLIDETVDTLIEEGELEGFDDHQSLLVAYAHRTWPSMNITKEGRDIVSRMLSGIKVGLALADRLTDVDMIAEIGES